MKRTEGATSGAQLTLTFLGSFPWPPGASTGPYRIDHLRSCGWEILSTNSHRDGRLAVGTGGRLVRASERVLPVWAQTMSSRHLRASSDATLAMFEGEGHALALARSMHVARSGGPFVIIACWLADLVLGATPAQLRKYRLAYRGVDHVVVFSGNQVEVLVERLNIPESRVHVVPFGIDLDDFAASQPRPRLSSTAGELDVLAVGRDASRDWATLASAARGAEWKANLYTRPSLLTGLGLPPQLTPHAMVDRSEYLRAMATADVMVIPTGVHQYPAGQSVLGEAMASGLACVVTDTPALSGYATDGIDAIFVPPHDPRALREAVNRLADPGLRLQLGAAAQERMRRLGGAQAMWSGIDRVLRVAIDEQQP